MRFGSGEYQGVYSFSVSWRKEREFFHPPVGLLSRVIRKAERERAEGVLVAPDWPGSGQMSLVEEKVSIKKLRLAEKDYVDLECHKEIVSDTFRGVPKFGFNVYIFDFLKEENKVFYKCVLMCFCSVLEMRVESSMGWMEPEQFVDMYLAGR